MSVLDLSYHDIVDALDEELQACDRFLSGLTEREWSAETKLVPLSGGTPWTVRILAHHIDFAMNLALELIASPQETQIARDYASFWIFDRSTVGPTIYQLMIDLAGDSPAADVHAHFQQTSKSLVAAAGQTPEDLVGPAFFGPMTQRDMTITRVLEALVHGTDLADAVGQAPYATERAIAITAATLDEILARAAVPGRPADLQDDLTFIRVASGRQEHPDPRFPIGL
jgi:Mycothiol maleylpyruvate isomerase N-terminal domain